MTQKLEQTHYTVIEAARDFGCTIHVVLQNAATGALQLLAMANKWEADSKQEPPVLLSGWVELDTEDVQGALSADQIVLTKVSQNGDPWTLKAPQTLYLGAIFISAEEYQRILGAEERVTDSPEQAQRPIDLRKSDYLSTTEAAQYLNYKPNTLAKMRTKGTGPEFDKLPSGQIRYHRIDLDSWAKSDRRGRE